MKPNQMIGSILLAAACVHGAGLPVAEFKSPSVANRPETWFHFIGGNVARPGITADLEAIQGAGISGIHLFHGQFGGKWPGVEPQITCLSAPWDGLVGFVADECKRLGLTFTMQNCPGWAMSGGPWIKPENAMRHLVWKRIEVEGGKRVEVKLPTLAPSAPDPRDYRDVVVLAFPATVGQWDGALKPAKVTSNIKADWDAWRAKGTAVPIDGGVTATITFDFAEPVTIRTVELPTVNSLGHGFCYDPETTVICEANGKTLFTREIPQANWQDDKPLTFSCDETTTQQLKVTLKPRHAIKLGRINLFSSARNDDWEAQAGWTLRSLMRNPPAKQSEAAWVKSAEVRDVSKLMKPDGTFTWDAPAGKWAVIRVGHVNTMRKNAPAPKEGTGFECDKLSTKGADAQFDGYIGRLSGENGPVKGKIARMLMDSWECKRQTWTPGLDKVFRERLGYDLLKWMPAIFGYVVDSPETTARFLNDWRGFLGDLVSDNFYAQMAKRCHDRGIDITFETSFGDVLPGDVMRFYKYADIPMCEFWQPRQHGYVGDHNFKPVYPCVSAAHLYGKKSVAAEALTSFQLTWDEKLRDLKYVANLHIARGVSHMVFHTYTHNPRTDWLPPGTSFGAHIGTPFLRGQTWWKFMPDFTAYLARCQAMLEAGKPANDVLWYLGDEWDHKPNENAPFPAGYKFDYCNPDALLTRISVNNKGEWVTPDGIAYRILWVPESKRMMPETMEKILAGMQKGAKAAFAALPESISTLRGGAAMQARFDKARAAMKASKNIYVGRSLEAVLAAEKIAKDVIAEGVVWNHRRSDDADWYFLASARQGVGIAGAVGFRCEGEVEIWHPETGLPEKVYTASVKDGRTWVALSLAPHKSCFVVFRRGGKLDPRSVVSIAKDGKALASAGPDHIARPREICTVLEARYGDLETPGRWADVSDKLQNALDTRKAQITVGNAWAECDPAYQTPKSFFAKVRLPDGKVVSLSARENKAVTLPQAESTTLIRENGGGYPIPFESGDYTITRADGTVEGVRMSFDVTTLAGPWNVSFPGGWGMPGKMKIDALKPWKALGTTPEAKAFSGTADYTIDFTLDKVDEGAIVVLDLGRVESLAKVEVNGKDFGDVWSPPYRIPLTGAVKAGKNTLKVSVTDTWFNRLVFDAGQLEEKRRTWTIAGPRKGQPLHDSGLIGPVRIIRCRFAETKPAVRAVTPTASNDCQQKRHTEKMPVVVIPAQPTVVERSAAAELAGELGKCLGETPKVVSEADLSGGSGACCPATAVKLYVGATKAAKKARADGSASRPYQVDEVFLKSVDGGVVMDGDPARAPLYAVDLYLEKYCGVRWWTSDAATYPKLSAVPANGIDLQYAPQFKYRETYYLDGFDPLFKVRSKGNFTSLTRYLLTDITFIPSELGGNHRLYFFKGRHSAYHSFFEILPPKVYFEKHPEWYSLVNGKREPKQLCLANKEMKEEYIKETLKRLREDSSVDFIQVSQNDWHGYCTCAKCKAMMDEDGGAPSGPYLRFANEVAEAVEKEFPNVRIDTFAYQFTRRAPTKTKPRHNVVVRLCDIECDFARPLANPLPPREAKFAKDLVDWKRVAGGNLFIWDYLANFHNYMMPHPNINSIAPNIRLFAENGAVGVFEQGDAICSAGTFATLRHYVTSHLLWDPKDDENRLMDEFMEGYYGKSAAPFLKKFIAVIEAGPRKTKQVVKCGHKGAPFLGGGDKLEAARLMDEAVAAAAKEGEPFASRVRRERLTVDHMLLLNYDILRNISAKLGYTWTRPATKAEAVENWIRDVKSFGVKARRETTRADELEGYFKSLRGSSKPPAAAVSTTTVPLGNVRVGFTIETGEWKPSKDAKSGGGIGSDRALVHASVIPHGQMKSLSVTTNGNVVTAVWKGHPVCGENFTVTAKMTLRPDGGFEYTSFDYTGNESGLYPKRIVFPEVVVPRTEKTALFRPFFAGDILRPNWLKMKPMQRVYSSGLIFKVFNCMAALEEGGVSHFFDQRGDARLYASAFEVTIGSAPNTLVLRNIWLPPVTDETRKTASLPYTGVYAPYRGGWYEAAKMHRAWMETQPWFKAAAARDFSKLREIDLWMWSRGNIDVSEPPVHWFMKETGLKVALDWYWWHNVPYDTSYPYFWPPRDGEDAFRAAVKRMKDRGAFVQVYTNGMLWDEDDPRWAEGGLESTIVRESGKIHGTTFNPFTKQSQGHMCGEAPKFHAKMRALEKTLASTGLDGVYIDMISCAAHLPCFNPRHKHAPGDAHALIKGYRDYVNAIHSDNPGFLLSSEATSEDYLDRFESFIMLYSSWERNNLGTMPREEPVPAVTVMYRGAGVIFGSFATPGGIPGWDPLWGKCPDKPDVEKQIAKYPDQFAVEFARGIVWGLQPMVHNFVMRDVTNPRVAKDIQFMKDSAKFYHDNKDFLFDGEMLKPAKLTCATKRVPFLKTSSYKRPHESKECVQPALPTVFHSEWRAPDGRTAAVLVNWTREEQKYELDFAGVKMSGILPALSWKLENLSEAKSAREVAIGDARVGWSLDTGVWQKAKKTKRGGTATPRVFVKDGSVTCGQMKSLSVTTNGNVVTAVWKGHPACGDNFTVTADFTRIPGGGFEYSSFKYSGNESGRSIQRISFPQVVVPRTEKTAIFRPNTVGEVFRPDWKAFGSGKDVSTSGANWLTFSCIAALNDGGTSHFLDQRGEARLHTVAFAVVQGEEPGTIMLCNRYAPPLTDERKVAGSLPYTGVYAPYTGGWYEAAKMHRAWLETTPWFKKAAARDFSKLREIALWMWSRGGVEVSEPPVHWFMKETGLKVALDWYWWHGIPYDTSFPYFWPPRDGVEDFRAAVKRMKERGAFVQVYTNGASWDCDDPRWADGGIESAILSATGRPFAKMYNVFTRHRLARICGEAPKFQTIIRTLERNLRESGLDGVYMDQISCGAHSPCYNPRHRHAPGGDAVEKGYREYVQAVRDENPGFILSSEATSETYFDLFEAAILLYSSWERCGKGSLPRSEPVPAVSVIYRGAAVVFGSFATPGGAPAWDPMWGKKPDGDEVEAVVAKYPDQFAVELARGIVWGIQPMVHNFTMKDVANPRLAKDLQFMKDSARFYHDNRDFLFDGELLRPAKICCATKRVEFLSASCYKRVKDSSTFVQEALPTVFHSEWRAKDGRTAAVLVNWTRDEQKYELECDGTKECGVLPPLSWKLARK